MAETTAVLGMSFQDVIQASRQTILQAADYDKKEAEIVFDRRILRVRLSAGLGLTMNEVKSGQPFAKDQRFADLMKDDIKKGLGGSLATDEELMKELKKVNKVSGNSYASKAGLLAAKDDIDLLKTLEKHQVKWRFTLFKHILRTDMTTTYQADPQLFDVEIMNLANLAMIDRIRLLKRALKNGNDQLMEIVDLELKYVLKGVNKAIQSLVLQTLEDQQGSLHRLKPMEDEEAKEYFVSKSGSGDVALEEMTEFAKLKYETILETPGNEGDDESEDSDGSQNDAESEEGDDAGENETVSLASDEDNTGEPEVNDQSEDADDDEEVDIMDESFPESLRIAVQLADGFGIPPEFLLFRVFPVEEIVVGAFTPSSNLTLKDLWNFITGPQQGCLARYMQYLLKKVTLGELWSSPDPMTAFMKHTKTFITDEELKGAPVTPERIDRLASEITKETIEHSALNPLTNLVVYENIDFQLTIANFARSCLTRCLTIIVQSTDASYLQDSVALLANIAEAMKDLNDVTLYSVENGYKALLPAIDGCLKNTCVGPILAEVHDSGEIDVDELMKLTRVTALSDSQKAKLVYKSTKRKLEENTEGDETKRAKTK